MTGRSYLLVFVIAICIFQSSLCGCVHRPATHPIGFPKLTVHENKILSSDQAYAELRFYGTAKISEKQRETSLFSRTIQHRGIAIYYYSDKTLIWIYPKDKSWQDDVDHCCRSQTQGYYGWTYDVTISEDGQRIYYKTPGLMHGSSWAYSVAERSSKLIGRD
jgi:hypothetical protein